jgi:hypothetical protein
MRSDITKVNKKIAAIISLLVLTAISGLLQACAEAQPSLEVLSLDITPAKITTGEKTTIKVEIRNDNAETYAYNVPLMVNGVADDRRSITLAPGVTELIIFTLTKSQPGTYTISVGDRESTLVVEKPLPPEFQLSNLEINPAEVDVGQNVFVSAKIANVGGTQGSYNAELKIDAITIETEKLIIPAGTDNTLVFKICKCLPGDYTVTLGSLTGQFVVREPFRPISNIPPYTSPTPDPGSCRTRG